VVAQARVHREAGRLMPRWLQVLAGLIAVIWVLSNPAQAGHDIHGLIASVVAFGQSVSS
jgi:hypothetical protein